MAVMWKPPRPTVLAFVVLFSLASLFIASGRGLAQAEPERFGMTEEQYREFSEQAKRFGLTPEGLKKWVDAEIGTPLMYDKKHKVAVGVKLAPDGSARAINIFADDKGDETIAFTYELGDEARNSHVTYSGAIGAPDANDPRGVYWRDLNADGVFDKILIPGAHNELLNLGRGMHILLDGTWTRAQGGKDLPPDTVKVGAIFYRFDRAKGRWLNAQDP